MGSDTALIIANVFFAASFLAERSVAWWATFIFGWIWIGMAVLAKFVP